MRTGVVIGGDCDESSSSSFEEPFAVNQLEDDVVGAYAGAIMRRVRVVLLLLLCKTRKEKQQDGGE